MADQPAVRASGLTKYFGSRIAVDRVDLVADVRDEVSASLGLDFHLHTDAAWGGYAIAVTRGADGRRRSLDEVRADYEGANWPDEGLYRALCAVARTDSGDFVRRQDLDDGKTGGHPKYRRKLTGSEPSHGGADLLSHCR